MAYNVFDDELDVEREDQHPGYTVGGTIVGRRLGMEDLGVTLYVLPPGNAQAPYHWHHNTEEALLVLAGNPTLRTPAAARARRPRVVSPRPGGSAQDPERHVRARPGTSSSRRSRRPTSSSTRTAARSASGRAATTFASCATSRASTTGPASKRQRECRRIRPLRARRRSVLIVGCGARERMRSQPNECAFLGDPLDQLHRHLLDRQR